jgi:hypothetical protein
MVVQGICRLCGSETQLQQSHIIPRFVFEWQKRTSSTGYLRFGQQINKRQQDGLKHFFLCAACEARFNVWETPFATHMFLPYHERGMQQIEFDSWLLQFCVSISWRVLTWLREQGYTRELDADYAAEADAALATWRAFLLGEREDIAGFEQHLFPAGPITSADIRLPANIQRYLMRAVEIDRIWTQQSAFSFAKMGRFVLVGFIREPEAAMWQGTKVSGTAGIFAPRELQLPDWLPKYLMGRAERIAELQDGLSPRQEIVIHRTQRANPERVGKSETLQAMLEDLRLRGEQSGPK